MATVHFEHVYKIYPNGYTAIWGDIMSFGVMMVAPILLVFLLFQKWFVEGVAATGTKG